jgi:hypothetical protein
LRLLSVLGFQSLWLQSTPGNNPACSEGVGGCSTAKVIGLIVFVTFANYWITEVLKNVIHVTISGVYGSWYFCSQKPVGFLKGLQEVHSDDLSPTRLNLLALVTFSLPLSNFSDRLAVLRSRMRRLQGAV